MQNYISTIHVGALRRYIADCENDLYTNIVRDVWSQSIEKRKIGFTSIKRRALSHMQWLHFSRAYWHTNCCATIHLITFIHFLFVSLSKWMYLEWQDSAMLYTMCSNISTHTTIRRHFVLFLVMEIGEAEQFHLKIKLHYTLNASSLNKREPAFSNGKDMNKTKVDSLK